MRDSARRVLSWFLVAGWLAGLSFGPLLIVWLLGRYGLLYPVVVVAAVTWATYTVLDAHREILREVFGIWIYPSTVKKEFVARGTVFSRGGLLLKRKGSRNGWVISFPWPRKRTAE